MLFPFQNGENNGPLLLKKKAMLLFARAELLFLPGSIKSAIILMFHTTPQILRITARKPEHLVVRAPRVRGHVVQLKHVDVK
jgi:hypothetical protein